MYIIMPLSLLKLISSITMQYNELNKRDRDAWFPPSDSDEKGLYTMEPVVERMSSSMNYD